MKKMRQAAIFVLALELSLSTPFKALAFLPPSSSSSSSTASGSVSIQLKPAAHNIHKQHSRPRVAEPRPFPATSSSSLSLSIKDSLAGVTSSVSNANLPSLSLSVDTASLTQYFLETLISYGVPAFFWIVIIAFAAKSFRGAKKDERSRNMGPNGNLFGVSRTNVVNELYSDLYDSTEDSDKSKSPFSMFAGGAGGPGVNKIPKNLGIPKNQYLQITKLNDKYASFQYSLTAATQSKAKAAAQFRSQAFDSALQRAFDSSINEISNAQKVDLLLEEKEFLNKGSEILESVTLLQTALTSLVIEDEFETMDVEIGEVDAHTKVDPKVIDATIVESEEQLESEKNDTNATSTSIEISDSSDKKKEDDGKNKSKSKKEYKKEINKLIKEIEKQNTELLKLEMEFIRAVVEIMGPDRANGIRAALLSNVSSGGSGVAGGLLKSLQDRPLSLILNTIGYSNDNTDEEQRQGRNVFVTDFPGDVSASQVETLREEVTAIITAAKPGDEALLVLQTGGGTVTGYGLAAAQLQRFKQHGMKLTICVEQVAASGGYMMTCVADKVIASPFAVLGSIGVISDLPNVYERLKSEGIEFQTVTAGKYKRTLTPTKKVTKEDVQKQKEDLEDILTLFKAFVKENRPALDIDDVATGETWFGEDALAKGLCDELNTVDDVLVDYVNKGCNVYQVKYDPTGFPQSPLSGLLPIGGVNNAMQNANGNTDTGIVRGAVKWLLKSIIPIVSEEIRNEMNAAGSSSTTSQIKERYMIKDPNESSKNIQL